MIRIFILEDQRESRMALERILDELDEETLICSAQSLAEGKEMALQGEFDLFLLDVNLDPLQREDASGLDFAAWLRGIRRYEFTPIVMITSVASLEMSAYRQIHCYQYLIKPYRREEVEHIVKRLSVHLDGRRDHSIVVKKDGINYRISCSEIIYIKAIHRGICIRMKDGQMEIRYLTIRQVLEMLPEGEFIQCHRMYVVQKRYVDSVDLVNRIVRMQGCPEDVEIGKTYKNEIRKQLFDD